jgi:molecular chaperone GrpE
MPDLPPTEPPSDSRDTEPTAPSAAPTPPVAASEEQLIAARKEAADNYDRFLRAAADLENYRRRATREKEELKTSAAVNLIQHLLPVVDSLQFAVTAALQDSAARTIAEGVAIALDQFKGVLVRHGVKELNPAGQKFDPHLHESLAHQPSVEIPEEHVLQVVRVGYSLHGRILRPASVILSSGPAKEEKEAKA